VLRVEENVQRFRGGLVFKAHRLVYHSTLGLRVINKKKVEGFGPRVACQEYPAATREWILSNGTVINLRTTSQKCAAVPRRARI